jgi:D-glycero-alpha-D-manno-heptose 1-phosphate guanylyltransferase
MIKECIILAGGLGTRLRSEVADLPKCMAPVAGRPFLYWVIANLISQGVQSFIFSLGYMHEKIEAYILETYPHLETKFCVEENPLGTGGAIQFALKKSIAADVLILNGDTLFEISNKSLFEKHISSNAACTIVLKPMKDFDRYGCVTVNETGRVIAFQEKKLMKEGLINGGIYLINKKTFSGIHFPEKFSFENEFLESYIEKIMIMAVVEDTYFIDIGIPADFKKANEELKQKYYDTIG